MKPDHRQIEAGKKCRRGEGEIPEHSEKRRHLEVVIPVLAALHEPAERTGKYQSIGGVVADHNDPAVQDLLRRPVRPFCCLILGKRGVPGVVCQLFHHAAVQDPVDLIFVQSVFQVFQKLFPDKVFHIQDLHHRLGTDAKRLLLHFQPCIPDPFAHKGGIYLHRVGKTLPGTAEHLFCLGAGNSHIRVTFAGDFQRLVITVHKKHGVARQKRRESRLHIRKFFHIRDPKAVVPYEFPDLIRRYLPEMVDHLSQGGVVQHDVGHRHFDVHHQAVHLRPVSQPHGADQDIRAVRAPFPDIFLILPEI